MRAFALTLGLLGTAAAAETAVSPCQIGSDRHGTVLSVPMDIAAIPDALRADHVVEEWQPGEIVGLGLHLPYDRFAMIERAVATTPDWALSDGVRVGLSRSAYLALRPDPVLTEQDGHPVAWTSDRADDDDPGSTCIETVRFDPTGRIVDVSLAWAPMTISPARDPGPRPERRAMIKP